MLTIEISVNDNGGHLKFCEGGEPLRTVKLTVNEDVPEKEAIARVRKHAEPGAVAKWLFAKFPKIVRDIAMNGGGSYQIQLTRG